MNRIRRAILRYSLSLVIVPLIAFSTSCVSPPTIERAGIEYDRAVNNVILEQLLLNIARARFHHPITLRSSPVWPRPSTSA